MKDRHFTQGGLPLCAAGLPMPLRLACIDRTITMPTNIGARLRYTLDRQSQDQALDIERPYRHNRRAIANCNALIYTLINLHLLQRIRARRAATD